MRVLGIETSCDETAAAIVSDDKEILSNVVLSQIDEHQAYGGVVPEIAARAHMEHMEHVLAQALYESKLGLSDIDAVAATTGPGLIGGVIVGTMMGKSLASVLGKPFVAVNHLEGHALTVRLTHEVGFPFLLLLVSGGHCQFLSVEGVGRYTKLGGTIDDALGEAFDKTAKMMGLGYPGGPIVESLAREGDAERFAFSVPLKGRAGCDFSFSGLKTSVRTTIMEHGTLTAKDKADICASFQNAAAQSICDRIKNAVAMFKAHHPDATHFVLAGGVAANRYLRAEIENCLTLYSMTLVAPPLHLCTDNAAMIAWAGLERYRLGMTDGMDCEPKARWSLGELTG